MQRRLAHGLVRLGPLGQVLPCNYDFDTQRMGPLQFDMRLAYTTPYVPAADGWDEHSLWRGLMEAPRALGAVIANNHFLVLIYPNGLVRRHLSPYVPDSEICMEVKSDFQPHHEVGYVRTKPGVKDVGVPPYRLFVDRENRAYMGGRLVSLEAAVPCTDTSLYKQLLLTGKSAVYMTDKGPTFV